MQKINLQNKKINVVALLLLGVTIAALTGIGFLEGAGCGLLYNPTVSQPATAYGLIMLPLNGLLFALLGVLIVTFQSTNRIGWILLLLGLTISLTMTTEIYAACSLAGTLPLPGVSYVVWFNNVLSIFFQLGFTFIPLLFPNGAYLSSRWRRFGHAALIIICLETLLKAVWPGPMSNLLYPNSINNPFAINFQPPPWLDNLVSQISAFMGVFVVAATFSLVLRWRHAKSEIRQQIKWLTFFLATSGLLFVFVEIIGVSFYPAIFDGWFYLVELAIFWMGFPVVIGLAVFKYRLYDIDFIIRRTLVYGFVTGILALIYLGAVIQLQNLFLEFTGQESPLAVVISTLVIATLFNPLRIRIQDVIDHRFYRKKYDAEKILASFAEAARVEVDVDHLGQALLTAVQVSMQPDQTSLWLAGDSEKHGKQYLQKNKRDAVVEKFLE